MSQEETQTEQPETVTKARLLEELHKLIANIENDVYDADVVEEIYGDVVPYTTGERRYLDPDIVKYLFIGMWITDSLRRVGNNEEPLLVTNEGRDLPFCPWCLKAQSPNPALEESEP